MEGGGARRKGGGSRLREEGEELWTRLLTAEY